MPERRWPEGTDEAANGHHVFLRGAAHGERLDIQMERPGEQPLRDGLNVHVFAKRQSA